MRFGIAGAIVPLSAAVIFLGVACRGATEVLVSIRTDVPCTQPGAWHGVAVYAGTPGVDLETREPSLTTTTCDATGHIGSTALVPNGADDAPVGVRVVAGLSRTPEECGQHGYEGCIVARRWLSFIPHTAVQVDVLLAGNCVGQQCDALHTCVGGSCVDARISAPPPAEGGVTGPSVRCGDNGIRCPLAGNVCCLTVNDDGGATGACMDPATCPPSSIVLRCDDESDCPGPDDDAGRPPVCCLDYEANPGNNTYCPDSPHSSACLPHSVCVPESKSSLGLGLCEDRRACQHGTIACTAAAGCRQAPGSLPGYFFCRLGAP